MSSCNCEALKSRLTPSVTSTGASPLLFDFPAANLISTPQEGFISTPSVFVGSLQTPPAAAGLGT